MKSNRIRNRLNEDLFIDRLNAVEWTVLAVILLCFFLTLFYGDNLGMFLTYFWVNEDLFSLNNVRVLGNNQLTYGIVQQWLCEIWTLPVNIVYRFVKFEPANLVTILWYKLSMVVVFVMCMAKLQNISALLGIEKRDQKWMTVLTSSCILVALPVFHVAQTDVLYLLFMLLGFEAMLKKDRKRFLLFFALSASCKVISVFVFLPLLLLWEKRLIYIVRDTIAVVIIVPLERVWYKVVDMIDNRFFTPVNLMFPQVIETDGVKEVVEVPLDEVNMGFFSHFIHKMLFFEIPAVRKGYAASTLIVLFVLLCIWCYTRYEDDIKKDVVFISALASLVFFTYSSPSPYWIVVMYPFVMFAAFMNISSIRINMLLINIYTFTMFLIYVIDQGHVYGGSTSLDYLLLQGLRKGQYDYTTGPTIAAYLERFHISDFSGIIAAICLASAIGFTVINRPNCHVDEKMDEKERTKVLHGFAIWQIAALGIWYILCVWSASSW